jgi:hypothetical protein
MATIVNARDVLLQATSPRVLTIALPSNQTVDFGQVNGTTKPSDNADVTVSAVNGGITVTGGGITLSAGGAIKGGKTAYSSGLGFFLGYNSPSYVFDIGGSGNYLRWDGSTLSYTGTLTGVGNIDIMGTAKFGGATTSLGNTWATVSNESLGSYGGVLGYTTTGRGTYGYATTSGIGASGTSAGNGTGVAGVSSSGIGVAAQSSSWYSMQLTGKALQDNSTYTWNGYVIAAPGGSTTTCLHNDGIYRDPVTTTRVNTAFGVAASGVCQVVVGNTGTCTVSGSGFNLRMGTGLSPTYEVNCSSNNAIMQSVSDVRRKKDIEPEKLGLDFVLQLAALARQFRMINDAGERLQHGWIAQDIEKLIGSDTVDGLVFTNEDGTMGINHILVISIMSKAVATLHERLTELEGERT